MHILFLIPYPVGEAPSQRFRFEQYIDILNKKGHTYVLQPFIDEKTWEVLYKPQQNLLKTLGIIRGFGKRFLILFKVYQFDFVFIHREASPLGPPIFEWLIAKVLKKKIIYDFDDAIWLPNTSAENAAVSKLKWHGKVARICKWSYKVSCGNNYLMDYARRFNENVVYIPTTIDTQTLHNRNLHQDDKGLEEDMSLVIGWTGTHSTVPYLNTILPVLQALEENHDFVFLVIANKTPDLALKSLQFKPWNKGAEIQDLMAFDIGLMPLAEDQWVKGKCGFKALQYMALEIPAVASALGVNKQIISDGISGYLCNSSKDWYDKIEKLILHPELRRNLGQKGREKVIKNYSVLSNTANFLGLFE